jgi:transcriptional regulator with XRE-family HTH domain
MGRKIDSSRGTAEDLRKLREEAGLTQTEACRLAGVPFTTWNNWERDPSFSSANSPPALIFSWLALYMKYQELVGFYPKRRKIGTKIQLRQEGEQL